MTYMATCVKNGPNIGFEANIKIVNCKVNTAVNVRRVSVPLRLVNVPINIHAESFDDTSQRVLQLTVYIRQACIKNPIRVISQTSD